MIFDCPTAVIFRMISLLMGLWWPRVLPPPASLLDPWGWARSLTRECNWETCPAQSLASLLIRLPATWRNIWHLCVSSPWLHAFVFPPWLCYQWEWLADIPGKMQATPVSISAMQPRLLGSCPLSIPWSIFKFPCLFLLWKEAKNNMAWLSPLLRNKVTNKARTCCEVKKRLLIKLQNVMVFVPI